jgi:hypothetical protein
MMFVVGCAGKPVPEGPVTARPQPEKRRAATRGIGRSVQGRPVTVATFPGVGQPVLIIGGIHGNEPTSAVVARKLTAHLELHPHDGGGPTVMILAEANPDGLLTGRRTNANGVDVNRNFPARNWRRFKHPLFDNGPSPASEPETQAILAAIEEMRPGRIVSIHSIDGDKHCNNYDGPAEWLAALMSRFNGYPVRPTMGYPTPGSLGSWAGADQQIPIVTLELPRKVDGETAWEQNRDALLAAISAEAPAQGSTDVPPAISAGHSPAGD